MSLFIDLRNASQFDKIAQVSWDVFKEIPEQLLYVTRLLCLPVRICSLLLNVIS